MKFKAKILFIFLFILSLLFIVHTVQAQVDLSTMLNKQSTAVNQQIGLSNQDPRIIAVNVIKVALGLLGTVFLALIVFAGFSWMTAGGETKKVELAQERIKNGVIGLLIILVSYSLVILITLFALRGTTDTPGATPSQTGIQGLPNY